MKAPSARTFLTALCCAAALALPLATKNAYFIQVASAMGISVVLALGLSLLYGFAGQMSFAHAGLFGIGAYTSVILTTKLGAPFLVGLLCGVLVPGIIACLIGIPTLRLRGHYLAIATLALQLAIVQFFVQASPLTGGTVGIFGIERPTLLGISFKTNAAYYELIAVAAVAAYLVAQQIVSSRFGRGLAAIREDEVAASVLGINPATHKIAAFTLSAMYAGLAGALFAYQILFISPVSFGIDLSISALTMVVIGGIGSNVGAVIGAALVTLIRQVLFSFGDLEFLIYGLWLMLIVIFFPGGIVGVARQLAARWTRRSEGRRLLPKELLSKDRSRSEAGAS
jgi:branched-chain amino acid transport system permease protein